MNGAGAARGRGPLPSAPPPSWVRPVAPRAPAPPLLERARARGSDAHARTAPPARRHARLYVETHRGARDSEGRGSSESDGRAGQSGGGSAPRRVPERPGAALRCPLAAAVPRSGPGRGRGRGRGFRGCRRRPGRGAGLGPAPGTAPGTAPPFPAEPQRPPQRGGSTRSVPARRGCTAGNAPAPSAPVPAKGAAGAPGLF